MEGACITAAGLQAAHYDFFWQVVTANIEYLAISVGIVLAAGTFLSLFIYFVNFKPMAKRLTDHENTLLKLTDDIEVDKEANQSKFDELTKQQGELLSQLEADQLVALTTLREEIQEENRALDEDLKTQLTESIQTSTEAINEKISELNRLAIKIELDTKWLEHYVWKARGVDINTLMSLNEYLELSLKHDSKYRIESGLRLIAGFLEGKNDLTEDDSSEKDELMSLLERVEGHDDLKKQITEKAAEVFSRKAG